MPEMVEIEKVEFERLTRIDRFMNALEAAGVDNWEGYNEACRIFREDHPEYDDE